MILEVKPVVTIMDEATHLAAALFVKKQSTTEIWKAIQAVW